MKTATQIRIDIINLLKGSPLAIALNGEIYHSGDRPIDSREEDIIVIHTTGTADQYQEGVATLNIYLAPAPNQAVGSRALEIEQLAAEWVATLSEQSDTYYFALKSIIETIQNKDTLQYFTVVKLKYELINL